MAISANRAPRGVKKAKRDYPVGIALAIIHIGALGVFIPAFFSWSAVAVGVALYVATGMGITLAYHRLLTHRSLVVPRLVEYALTVFGVLALQGGPIEWVAQHRAHHANTDRDGDPHDSHKGMPWSHIEWLFRTNKDRVAPEDRPRWAADLVKDPFYRFIERYNVACTVALALGLFAIGGWSWVIWGVFARLVFTYHCTWLVNSASHAVGYQIVQDGRPFDEQLVGRGAHVRRGLAQQPPRLPVLGKARHALVRVRPDVLDDQGDGLAAARA